jgi:Cu(I)/Ag(I) efflux system membrane protein CusA/SilA
VINRLIEASIANRWLVVWIALVVLGLGFWATDRIAVDAIPDLSDVQVIIQTDYSGQPPQVVEDQVTYPISTAMLSVPGARDVRAFSFFGLSFVYVIFEDGTDIYWARSRVLEFLSQLSDRLPAGAKPRLGPDATGVGWVYQYALLDTTDRTDLSDLRSIQDWFLKYELSALQGVAEVASVGGFVRQYQVEVDPRKLKHYGIPLSHVINAVKESTGATGAGLVELAETEFMVRSESYIGSLDDLRQLSVHKAPGKPPVLLSSVANVQLGPQIRRGVAELDGRGESVGGIIVMRYGENAREVIGRVKVRLNELRLSLPEGVRVVTVYDRTELIDGATGNLFSTLFKEMIIVVLVILLFLLHVRSTLVAVVVLPAGVALSTLTMHLLGINANIMSLGGIAIAIGVMVDASLVTVENAHKHLERHHGARPRSEIILEATKEVGPALFFSLLIITVSFLPVLVLEGQAGRLFAPLAYTKTFAMAASALLSITVVPALVVLVVRGRIRPEKQHPISRLLIAAYRPVIRFALNYRWLVVAAAVIVLAVTVVPLSRLGSEFMPPLHEGDLLYMPTTPPGMSVDKARELLQQTDRVIAAFPEVERVFGKAGRAETATDPAPLTMLETTIMLKPRGKWRPGLTPDMLIDSLDAAVQFPGLTNSWTMPIRTRIDMLATGIKTPVGIKIMGTDLDSLNAIAVRVEDAVRSLPGIRSVYGERLTGGNYLDIDIDRLKASAYGLTPGEIHNALATAVGGMNMAENVEGRERYAVSIRYPRELRDNPEEIARTLIAAPDSRNVPLGQVATLRFSEGAAMIKSENARPTARVFVDLENIDIGSFVARARTTVAEQVALPQGYSLVWSGQYENMQAVAEKLTVIVPLALFVILVLLYLHFRSFADTLIVMLSLPFSLVGGVWLMYLLEFNTSVAVYIGFIALAGLAAETGVVMIVYLNAARDRLRREKRLDTEADLRTAITEGAAERVRPKVMTVATTILALLPALIGTGTGAEVMQRIAAPMVGGMASSALLTLIVVPSLYYMIERRRIGR